MSKQDVIEVQGVVKEALPERDVSGRAAERPHGSGPYFREAADELHPDSAGR